MTRGILATCYARPAVDGLSTSELLGRFRDVLRRRAVRRRHRRLSGDEGHARLERRAGQRPLRRTYDTVLALGALDNLVKGASGQAIQCANLLLGLPETHRASPLAGLMPVSVTRGARIRGRRARRRDQAVGRARSRDRGHRRPCAGRRHRCVHVQPRRGRAGADQPRSTCTTVVASAVVLNSGNANAATGEAGRRDAAAHVRAHRRRSLGCVPRDVLVCSTGPDRHPDADGPRRAGIPKLAAALAADAEGGAAAATAILTTDTVRKETVQRVELARRRRRHHRRHGQGRGDALPGDGHDARGAHDRRRGRSEHAAHDARRARSPTRSTAYRRRLHEHERHRARCWRTARSGTRRSRARAVRTRRSATGSTPCAPISRARWRPTPRVPPSSRRSSCAGARSDGRGAHRGPRRRAQPARAVLALRQRPVLGPRAVRAGRERRRASIPSGSRSRTRAWVCRDGIAAPHDEAAPRRS